MDKLVKQLKSLSKKSREEKFNTLKICLEDIYKNLQEDLLETAQLGKNSYSFYVKVPRDVTDFFQASTKELIKLFFTEKGFEAYASESSGDNAYVKFFVKLYWSE